MAGKARHGAWGWAAWTVALLPLFGGCGDDGGEGVCAPAQCPGSDTTCSIRICNADGSCGIERPVGIACSEDGGALCDGAGQCVECLSADDCPGGVSCDNGSCAMPSCSDGLLNGDEGDIDCGGSCPNPCQNDESCNMAADCASGFCSNGSCAPCQANSDCPDDQNCDTGSGVCVGQGTQGQPCMDAGSCDSGFCADGVCCDSACDGACESCAEMGQLGSCSAYGAGTDPEMECVAPDACNGAGSCGCDDGMMGGGETDIDCGGAACMPCSNGMACMMPSDCLSGACINNVCVAPNCMDMQLNGAETDVDCGGAVCAPCADNLACIQGSDCVSGVCSGNTCQPSNCMDMTQNAAETDVDCGGPVCSACAVNQMCLQPSDCQSGICTNNVCTVPNCMDMLLNGQETDVDCGGPTCNSCNAGQSCMIGSDCLSGVCNANVCACSPALDVLDDGSGANGGVGLPDLVMSEISPGNFIELYNTTASPINLGASTHWLCSPFDYTSLAMLAPMVTVPAGGYATVPWPMIFTDVNAGGEILLYASPAFSDNTQILDFTCWGINPHGSRKMQAELIGKWIGGCNAALSQGSYQRNVSTTGITAADYSTVNAQSPMNCVP